MEKFLYEVRPLFYGGLSLIALFNDQNSKIMVACAFILGACGLLIGYKRHTYRKIIAQDRRMNAR